MPSCFHAPVFWRARMRGRRSGRSVRTARPVLGTEVGMLTAAGDVGQEWRCSKCGKLLGVATGRRLRIQFARGHQYIATLPVTATCRGCRTLNETEGIGKEGSN